MLSGPGALFDARELIAFSTSDVTMSDKSNYPNQAMYLHMGVDVGELHAHHQRVCRVSQRNQPTHCVCCHCDT